jgi:hypothetical protein
MVIVWLPILAFLPTFTVMVEVPAPVIEVGLKVTVCAPPSPEADRLIAESKPPDTVVVIVEVPELSLATLIEVGDALIAKPAVVLVIVKETVVVSIVLPEVPVTLMG